MARAIAAARSGFRRVLAVYTFAPPAPAAATVLEPSSNSLFVSAKVTNSINQSNLWSLSPLYGSRRLFSISAFTPPPPAAAPPQAEPNCNLFVSGLSKRTTSEGLREAFEKFGQVVQARVVTDCVSGYSKGFGFVRYATLEDAAKGKEGMDGKFLDGWVIFAEYARPRPPPPAQQPQTSEPSSGYQPGYQMSHSDNYQSQSGYQSSQSTSEPPYSYQPPSGYQTSSGYQSAYQPSSGYQSTGYQPSSGYQSAYQPSSGYQSAYQPTPPSSDYQAPSGYQSGYQPTQPSSDYQAPSAYQSGYQPTQPSSDYQAPTAYEPTQHSSDYQAPSGYQPPSSQSTYHPPSGYQTSHPSSNYQTLTGYPNPQTSADHQTQSLGYQTYQPIQQNSSGYQNAPGAQTTEASSGNQGPSGFNEYEASA